MQEFLNDTKTLMQKSLDAYRAQLSKLHTGRATTALIEDLLIDYYGNRVPLKQIANLAVPEPRQITVTPWDQGAMTAIEKGISTSNLGFTPLNEGRVIRINLPEMTQERRQQLKKVIDDETEKCRIALRMNRQDMIKLVKQSQDDKALSEDEGFRLQEEIQKITDQMNAEAERIHAAKVQEVMTV